MERRPDRSRPSPTRLRDSLTCIFTCSSCIRSANPDSSDFLQVRAGVDLESCITFANHDFPRDLQVSAVSPAVYMSKLRRHVILPPCRSPAPPLAWRHGGRRLVEDANRSPTARHAYFIGSIKRPTSTSLTGTPHVCLRQGCERVVLAPWVRARFGEARFTLHRCNPANSPRLVCSHAPWQNTRGAPNGKAVDGGAHSPFLGG